MMFNDNDCFGNIKIKIRPSGKYLCLSFEFHKPHAPRSFCIKYVVKRRERRVRAITSAQLREDGHLTVRPLGREFGSAVPSNLSGSSGPLCAELAMAGNPSPAAAQVTGRLCSPVPRKEHGHSWGVGSGRAQHRVPALTNAHPAPLGMAETAALRGCLSAEPRHVSMALKRCLFPGSTGVWIVFSWISLP